MIALAFLINLAIVITAALVLREIIADWLRPWQRTQRPHACPHRECWSCSYESLPELTRHLRAQHEDEAVWRLPRDGGPVRWEVE